MKSNILKVNDVRRVCFAHFDFNCVSRNTGTTFEEHSTFLDVNDDTFNI